MWLTLEYIQNSAEIIFRMEKSADTKTLSEAVRESMKYLSRKDNDFFDKLTSRFTIGTSLTQHV